MAEKPRKLIIHAGIHKTGSTAIQHWLHSTSLPEAHYFSWRHANHSDLFVLLFEENPQEYFALAHGGYTRDQAMRERQKAMARLRREIEGSDKEVFIFSAERVSTAPVGAVREMQAFFSEVFADIQVYAYVRRPSGFMTSMFQQHLKTGEIKLSFAKLWPGYRGRLQRLDRIFGADRVHLRSFDALIEQGTEVVGDFAAWTGLTSVPPKDIALNRSMRAAGMALLYFYRKRIEPGVPAARRARYDWHVLSLVQNVPGERFEIELVPEGRQRLRVEEDLAWISARTGLDFDDRGVRREGVLVFRDEDEILDYAVGASHLLAPQRRLAVLDPQAPGSLDAAMDRFRAVLSPSARLRAVLRRALAAGR